MVVCRVGSDGWPACQLIGLDGAPVLCFCPNSGLEESIFEDVTTSPPIPRRNCYGKYDGYTAYGLESSFKEATMACYSHFA